MNKILTVFFMFILSIGMSGCEITGCAVVLGEETCDSLMVNVFEKVLQEKAKSS